MIRIVLIALGIQAALYVLSWLLKWALLLRTWYRAQRTGRNDPALYPLLLIEATYTPLGRADIAVFWLARWWRIIPGYACRWLTKRGSGDEH
jgi:hypothetical protein